MSVAALFAPRRLALTALTSLSLLALPVLSAQAALQDNLRHTPAQANSFFSLSTDYKDWQYFMEREPFKTMLAQFQAEIAPDIARELGIDLQRELLPMLGSHMTVALYDSEPAELLPALIALDLAETESYAKLVQRLEQTARESDSKKLLQSSYRGVTLYGFAGHREQGIPYMALSGQTLLFGSQPLIKKALDTQAQAGPNILKQSGFDEAHAALHQQKFWLYAQPEKLSEALGQAPLEAASAQELRQAEAEMQQALAIYDSLGLGLDLSRNGLVLKSFLRLKDRGLPATQQAYVNETLKIWRAAQSRLQQTLEASPRRPLIFASMDGVNLLSQGVKLFSKAQDLKALQQAGGFFKRFTNLDFEKDLLAYSDGRGGMFSFYPEDTVYFDRLPQTVLMLGVKDNAAFQKNLLSKLRLDLGAFAADQRSAKAAKEQILFSAKPSQTYQGHALYIAQDGPTLKGLKQSLFIEPAFAHVDKLWLFASSPEALKQTIDLLQGRSQNLAGNAYFDRLRTVHGIEKRTGLMFMDLHQLARMVSFIAGEDEEVEMLKPSLSAFHAIMAGGKYSGRSAEGIFVVDVNMDKVDFEMLGRLFKDAGSQSEPSEMDFSLD